MTEETYVLIVLGIILGFVLIVSVALAVIFIIYNLGLSDKSVRYRLKTKVDIKERTVELNSDMEVNCRDISEKIDNKKDSL